jgi:heme oxygenase (biliverdin-IX-beta and delta-forming)
MTLQLKSLSAHAVLRAHTAPAHARVDKAFTRFDLARQESYVRFLQAHGCVLPLIEAALGHAGWGHAGLPRWRPRTGCLSRDLAAFDQDLPAPFTVTMPSGTAERFGLLYVIEGSRLGGRLLLHRVDPGFSSHYLSAIHEPGEWRAFTKALDACAKGEAADWLAGVIAGALEAFQLYESAAEAVLRT